MTNTVKLLRELIARPSVNPAFRPEGDVHAGERFVAEYLEELARHAGFSVERQPIQPDRWNVLIRYVPLRGRVRHRVVLAPHMDTVGGNDLPGEYFTPRLKQGRLHGRGACDTKGSLAAMFMALQEVAESRQRPAQTEILLACLVDEENNQAGSRTLIKKRLRADLAIVGEPTLLKVITAHKGDLWLELETSGKAAHGSSPALGRNAILEMARIVEALETSYADHIRKRSHPLLGHATINVGQIQGGRQPNIVPDRCSIRIDRRTVPGEKDASVKRELMDYLRQSGLKARMHDTKGVPSAPLDTDPGLPLVRQFMKTAGQARPRGVNFFSDAGVLGAGGIPSVVFGPGDIAQAHTEDEWIDVRQLDRARGILATFLSSLP
jgi:acetylornithine deacetylase